MAKRRFRVIDGGKKWTKPGAYGAPEPVRPETGWRRYRAPIVATIALVAILVAGMMLPAQLSPSKPAPGSASSSTK